MRRRLENWKAELVLCMAVNLFYLTPTVGRKQLCNGGSQAGGAAISFPGDCRARPSFHFHDHLRPLAFARVEDDGVLGGGPAGRAATAMGVPGKIEFAPAWPRAVNKYSRRARYQPQGR